MGIEYPCGLDLLRCSLTDVMLCSQSPHAWPSWSLYLHHPYSLLNFIYLFSYNKDRFFVKKIYTMGTSLATMLNMHDGDSSIQSLQ